MQKNRKYFLQTEKFFDKLFGLT